MRWGNAMDVLARLRSDMDDAGREAHKQDENETDACLVILDEFSAAHEVVRVARRGGVMWSCMSDAPVDANYEEVLVIVPRERKPSVLEAMETAHRYLSYLCRAAGDPGVTAEGARDALAEAIEKEKSNA